MKNRIISILLTLVLLLGCLPVTAFAADGDAPAPDGNIGAATPAVTFTIAQDTYGGTSLSLPEGVAVTDGDLLAGVSAADENGTPVTVTVKDADGLDTQNPRPQMAGWMNNPYMITYEAAHPVSGDIFTATREVYINLGVVAVTTATVTDAASLASAISNSTVDVIDITASFSIGTTYYISRNLTINGGGFTITQTTADTRHFNISSSTVTIQTLTLDGSSSGGGIANRGTLELNNATLQNCANNGPSAYGGGIENVGTLTLNNVTIQNCNCRASGGGIHNDGTSTLTISDSIIENCTAGMSGGGIYNFSGALTLTGVTIQGCNATYDHGGGIYNVGTANINGGTITNNTAGQYGGGIYNVGTANINGGTITNNTAGQYGKGIYNSASGGSVASINIAGGGTVNDGIYNTSFSAGSAAGINVTDGTVNGGIINVQANGTCSVTIGANGFVNGGVTGTFTLTGVVSDNATFTAQGSVNLINPTDLVFNAANPTPVAGYTFDGMSFMNVTKGTNYGQILSSSHGITYSGGTLTIPAAAFGQHDGNPLTPGIYRVWIRLKDGGTVYNYSADFTLTGIFDAGADAHFTFNGNYTDLAKVILDGTELTRTPIGQTNRAYLSGYGGYPDNLGLVEEGSVKVTLYKEFLRTLANGTYTLEVEFNGGSRGSLQFQIQQQASGQTSGSGSSARSTAPAETWLERNPAAALAQSAKNRGEDFARTKITGIYGVRGNAWEKLTGLRYEHDTTETGAVQVRVYVKNPEKLKKDTRVSGYVKGADVEMVKNRFEKRFKNELRVIHFDHQGAWGQPVDIAAKVDLTGMDTKNLYFYSYNKATNSYLRIKNPAYWIDKNGYLHFTTEYAGDIIISGGPLEPKGQN